MAGGCGKAGRAGDVRGKIHSYLISSPMSVSVSVNPRAKRVDVQTKLQHEQRKEESGAGGGGGGHGERKSWRRLPLTDMGDLWERMDACIETEREANWPGFVIVVELLTGL